MYDKKILYLAGVALVAPIITYAYASASLLPRTEKAFRYAVEDLYTQQALVEEAQKRAENMCQLLIAVKRNEGVEVKSETCGLDF